MRLNISESKTIEIFAKKYWNDTEIEIKTGEEYSFEADGIWCDLIKNTDADGYTNSYMTLFNKLKRSEDNNWFALMGSLNKSKLFLIGKSKTIIFKEDGNLNCFANDVRFFYWNNFKSISLKVIRLK